METLLYWYGVFMGSLILGTVIGLIPLLVGLKLGKKELAVTGFVCCIAGAFIWGIFLAVPCCIGFTIAIVVRRKKKQEGRVQDAGNGTYHLNASQDQYQEGCPWYRPGCPGNPPGCQWHGENGPFGRQE